MTARHTRDAAILPEGDLIMSGAFGDGLDGIWYEEAEVAIALTEEEVLAYAKWAGWDEGRGEPISEVEHRAYLRVRAAILAAADDIERSKA